jgi:uncharacterized protein YjiS (DUF1127 family)
VMARKHWNLYMLVRLIRIICSQGDSDQTSAQLSQMIS